MYNQGMHEFGLAQDIMAAVKQEVGEDFIHVSAIHIDVGDFSGVVAESLEFGLKVCLEDAEMNDTKIHVKKIPAAAICECENQYTINDIMDACPACNSFKRKITAGKDVIIKSLEVSG